MKKLITGILLVFGPIALIFLISGPMIVVLKILSVMVMLWVFAALIIGIVDAIRGTNHFSKWML